MNIKKLLSIINNFHESIKQKLIARRVNSLKIKVEKEISEVLVKLGNPLVGKFKNPMVDKVILIRYAIHEKSKYRKVEKLIIMSDSSLFYNVTCSCIGYDSLEGFL